MIENDFIICLAGSCSGYGILMPKIQKFQDAFEEAKGIDKQIIFFGFNIEEDGMNILEINKWFEFDIKNK